MDDLLSGTPKWFRRLVVPMVVAVMIAVPLTIYASEMSNRLAMVEAGMSEIQKSIDKLERKDDDAQAAIHRFAIQQARMEEKIQRILDLVVAQ